jgi:hypothetical protein
MIKNANIEHADSLTTNERIGVWVTSHIGTMYCAYLFAIIGIGSLVGVVTNNATLALMFGAVSSYFLQLVLLPVIMVGTNVQSKHDQIKADIQFELEKRMENDLLMIKNALKI